MAVPSSTSARPAGHNTSEHSTAAAAAAGGAGTSEPGPTTLSLSTAERVSEVFDKYAWLLVPCGHTVDPAKGFPFVCTCGTPVTQIIKYDGIKACKDEIVRLLTASASPDAMPATSVKVPLILPPFPGKPGIMRFTKEGDVTELRLDSTTPGTTLQKIELSYQTKRDETIELLSLGIHLEFEERGIHSKEAYEAENKAFSEYLTRCSITHHYFGRGYPFQITYMAIPMRRFFTAFANSYEIPDSIYKRIKALIEKACEPVLEVKGR